MSGRGIRRVARDVHSTSAPAPPDHNAPSVDGDEPGRLNQHKHYVERYQLWDEKKRNWTPFDPDRAPPKEQEFPGCYFVINVRYQTPSSEPELVVSNWSDHLLRFFRAVVSGDFFEAKPLIKITDLFIHLKKILAKQAYAASLLEVADSAATRAAAEALGYLEAVKATTSQDNIEKFLRELVEHLDVFVPLVQQEFQPIADKLALMQEYGHIEFDLLLYHFEAGQKLVYADNKHRADAFVLSSHSMAVEMGVRVLHLGGYGYQFDGDAFSQRPVLRKIREYKGTQSLNCIGAKLLPPELELHLKERGRLYSSFAGVFHKEYEGKRVIVDPKAYANRDGYNRDPNHVVEPLSEDDLYLLPADIKGFNLSHKVCQHCRRVRGSCPEDMCQSWQKFDVRHLHDVQFDEDAWSHLVLDQDTKLLIESLVRVTQNSNTSDRIISDVITGKGGGLISVLHGPPGTGKTLTAESLAEHLHRPLYMVSFSELSTTSNDLEPALKRILSLATAWDAILLIDEADVFLEQRSLHELERNALVSVALRLFEYHRGVLFLTTNRIKTFDDAFLSRFSICIKYPELDQAGRFTVWRKFFELAGCRVGSSDEGFDTLEEEGTTIPPEDVQELAEKFFNGRTIKNLVRTAQALALSSGGSLRVHHVQTVVRVQEKFLTEFAAN